MKIFNYNTYLKEYNGIIFAFNEDGVYIYSINNSLEGTYKAPKVIYFKNKYYELKGINNRAFRNCKQLKKIYLPITIENILPEAFFNCNAEIQYYDEQNILIL